MRAILDVVILILDLYTWIIIASAVFSWLYAFNVVNIGNRFVRTVAAFLYQATEPLLRPIRNVIPNLGAMDISPVILLLAVFFAQRIIIHYLYPIVF